MAVDGLRDDIQHGTQQFLALVNCARGAVLFLADIIVGVCAAGYRIVRTKRCQHIRHSAPGNSMRSQQAACADIIAGEHLQNVCAINAHVVLLAGCGERVVDEDDALARERHLASVAGDEAKTASRIAAVGTGQVYLAL